MKKTLSSALLCDTCVTWASSTPSPGSSVNVSSAHVSDAFSEATFHVPRHSTDSGSGVQHVALTRNVSQTQSEWT